VAGFSQERNDRFLVGRWLAFHRLLYLYGRIRMIRKLGIFVTYLFMASSCLEEPECLNLNNHIIGITFKNKSDGKAAVVTFTNIKALGSDSVFTATGNKVVAPLNYFKQETTYVFTQTTVVDTLQLSYKAQPQFVSVDCGERYVLSELKIVYHTFDSVRVLNRVPSNQTTANNIDIFN
jgi:hypothetical protein